MNLQEFKAWFDGYTENMKDEPSAKQWKRIKERVAEIDGTVTTYPMFVRTWPTYIPNYPPYISYPNYPHYYYNGFSGNSGSSNLNAVSGGNFSTLTGCNTEKLSITGGSPSNFNSNEAFYALGKAEAA